MTRLFLFLLTIVVVVLAVGYAVRSRRAPTVAVASLLPNSTIALAHVPDFERTRDDWHRSDIYQLYLEPSVQDFLRKPLSHVPHSGAAGQHSKELEQLDPKDAFLALTSTENDQPTFIGGFRYRGSRSDAEKIIGQWRAKLLGTSSAGATTETIDYQKASIEVSRMSNVTLCTTYEKQWFLAANRVESIEATIDRLRNTAKTSDNSLATDQNFRDAMTHMPAEYSLGFYVQPKSFFDKLANLQKSAGPSPTAEQLDMLSKIRSFCGATRFDGGKLHDFFFVGMPELLKSGDLTRQSLALTTPDTFLYGAMLLDLSRQFPLTDPSLNSSFLGERLQRIGRGLAAAGITGAEWQSVFGNEMGAMADWRSDNRMPSPLVAFPVKDFAKAKRMAVSLAHILDDDGEWAESDKDGIHFISSPYKMGFVTIQPTIAVSERFLVAGVDLAAVQAALTRVASGGSDVSSGTGYKQAVKGLPPPTRGFSYLDLGLLYGRVDAEFRPMLLMGAAFMPAMNEYVDVGKVPTAETIAKHLTPIVSSQRYEKDGYIGESIGPITGSQAAIGLAGVAIAGAVQGRALAPFLPTSPAGPAAHAPASGSSAGSAGPAFHASPSPTPVGTP